MVDSFVVSSKFYDGKSALTVVAKKDNPNASVAIIRYNDWVIQADPIILARGSLKVREYAYNSMQWLNTDGIFSAYDQAVVNAITSVAEDPVFRNPNKQVIYTPAFGEFLNKFPKDEFSSMCMIANHRIAEMARNQEKHTISRLIDENKSLRAELIKATRKKKRKIIPY